SGAGKHLENSEEIRSYSKTRARHRSTRPGGFARRRPHPHAPSADRNEPGDTLAEAGSNLSTGAEIRGRRQPRQRLPPSGNRRDPWGADLLFLHRPAVAGCRPERPKKSPTRSDARAGIARTDQAILRHLGPGRAPPIPGYGEDGGKTFAAPRVSRCATAKRPRSASLTSLSTSML